jgi:kynurenine formamidase
MARLIDLGHVIEDGMITYPGLPAPVISDFLSRDASREKYAGQAEFHIGKIELIANTGTYLDAPSHRFEHQPDISELPLSRLADLPGLLIAIPPDQRAVKPSHLEAASVKGRAVLIHTGWSRHWRTEMYGDRAHPYLSGDGARYLVDHGALLVGIDSINIDDVADPSRPAHTNLLRAGIPIVEHLTNLDTLAGTAFRFFAVPPQIRGLGTFAVRAFAAVEP